MRRHTRTAIVVVTRQRWYSIETVAGRCSGSVDDSARAVRRQYQLQCWCGTVVVSIQQRATSARANRATAANNATTTHNHITHHHTATQCNIVGRSTIYQSTGYHMCGASCFCSARCIVARMLIYQRDCTGLEVVLSVVVVRCCMY